MEEMTQAINAVTSPAVQIWMNWMLFIFVVSILFVWKHVAARLALLAFVLSAVLGLVIFNYTKQPHLIGVSHLILWTPLAIYLVAKVIKAKNFKARSPYGIWVLLLVATIVVSLVFDIKDVAMVLMGKR